MQDYKGRFCVGSIICTMAGYLAYKQLQQYQSQSYTSKQRPISTNNKKQLQSVHVQKSIKQSQQIPDSTPKTQQQYDELLVFGYFHEIEKQYKSTNKTATDIMVMVKQYYNTKQKYHFWNTECLNYHQESNNKSSIIHIEALSNNQLSTIYGDDVINHGVCSWRLIINRFCSKENKLCIGITTNDTFWLYKCLNVADLLSFHGSSGYIVDIAKMVKEHKISQQFELELILDLDKGQMMIGFIDKEMNNKYCYDIKRCNYRLALCIVGKNTEIEIS